ncbi:MAG: V-type ATPase subunit [Oscillospiraceae bacterium]|nr:V-type ATPase subunit [Oscillospiraceae bacterium]
MLGKARAMFGNSLKSKDFINMLNCRSVSEIAGYLKYNTSYASVLSNINESTIHRGHLEMILGQKQFNDYAALARYDMTVGLKMSDYIIKRAEIGLIISCLRLISAGRAGEFLFSMPMFFSSHTQLDLIKMSQCKSYNQLVEAMEHTVYRDILAKFQPKDNGKILLTEIETALFTHLTQTFFKMIEKHRPSTRDKLRSLFGVDIDVQNVTRILRLKRFFNAEPEFIRKNFLPFGNSISIKAMESMINAPTADAVMDIFLSTPLGRSIPESQRAFTYDLHHRVPYFAARRYMHYSIHPAVVMLSYIYIADIELDDIINIIEGVRYQLQPDEIKPMLVLANY